MCLDDWAHSTDGYMPNCQQIAACFYLCGHLLEKRARNIYNSLSVTLSEHYAVLLPAKDNALQGNMSSVGRCLI